MEFSDFISSVGGILGLYLGISAVGLVHFMASIIDYLLIRAASKKNMEGIKHLAHDIIRKASSNGVAKNDKNVETAAPSDVKVEVWVTRHSLEEELGIQSVPDY